MLVSWFVNATAALGTDAPVWSRTVPSTSAVSNCAKMSPAPKTARATILACFDMETSRILSAMIPYVLRILSLSCLAWCAAGADRILVQGHRGARARMPENTIPAFEYAIKQGVDALELDMAVTRDNVIVISHDPVLRPPVCRGPANKPIHQLTVAELQQWDCG